MSKYLVPLCDGGITKGFAGPSPKHWGVDYGWVKEINTPILAIADGVVKDNFFSESCGYSLVIQHEEDGKHRFCTFIHLKAKSTKTIGSKVTQCEVVGYRGNTGKSNGPHLHFGLTSITDKAYKWDLVKSLAINPQPLMYKSSKLTYTGDMFKNMPYLDKDEELITLREEVAALEKQVAELKKKISKAKEALD